MNAFLPSFSRLGAAFKRSSEDPEKRRARMSEKSEECVQIADARAINSLDANRSAMIQMSLALRAAELRAEMQRHLAHAGDGSVDHVTSLGVHIAGIECAMRANSDQIKIHLAVAKSLGARLEKLRAEIARDVAACDRWIRSQ